MIRVAALERIEDGGELFREREEPAIGRRLLIAQSIDKSTGGKASGGDAGGEPFSLFLIKPHGMLMQHTGLGLLRKLPSQEKAIIEAALRESGGRVYGPAGAASKLGMPRSTLESKIRSLKIDKNRFKSTYPSTPGN